MEKRVFIIHGWDGYPEEGWFPWLKRELETRGFAVEVPAMPESKTPKIAAWVQHLVELVGNVDEQTYFVGHSIGCQAILRFLERLPDEAVCGGVVLVAGWTVLSPPAYETPDDHAIARPWIETPLDWDSIQKRAKHWTAIFSDTDDFVPRESADIFRSKLGAEIIMEHDKGHFSGSDGVTELPSALGALLGMAP